MDAGPLGHVPDSYRSVLASGSLKVFSSPPSFSRFRPHWEGSAKSRKEVKGHRIQASEFDKISSFFGWNLPRDINLQQLISSRWTGSGFWRFGCFPDHGLWHRRALRSQHHAGDVVEVPSKGVHLLSPWGFTRSVPLFYPHFDTDSLTAPPRPSCRSSCSNQWLGVLEGWSKGTVWTRADPASDLPCEDFGDVSLRYSLSPRRKLTRIPLTSHCLHSLISLSSAPETIRGSLLAEAGAEVRIRGSWKLGLVQRWPGASRLTRLMPWRALAGQIWCWHAPRIMRLPDTMRKSFHQKSCDALAVSCRQDIIKFMLKSSRLLQWGLSHTSVSVKAFRYTTPGTTQQASSENHALDGTMPSSHPGHGLQGPGKATCKSATKQLF